MTTNCKYIQELEDLISDELLPAFIENQRRRGLNPNASPIIKKLLKIMKSKRDVPMLFQPPQEK